MYKIIITLLLIPAFLRVSGQTNDNNTRFNGADFLTISPNARASAMGGIGSATEADVYSIFWNAAKNVYNESQMEVSYTYSPWMREVAKDMNLSALAFYRQIDDRQAISAGFRYFSYGEIQFTDGNGLGTGDKKPYEMSIDLAYSRLLSRNLSAAVTLRYIRSQLGLGQVVNGIELEAANAVAADISLYYNRESRLFGKTATWRAGLTLANIGSKLKYGDNTTKAYLPGDFRLGIGVESFLAPQHSLSLTVEANALMIPREEDGKQSDKSSIGGYFASFGDIQSDNLFVGIGAEYWYARMLALRAGYHYGNKNSGRPTYASVGFGIKYFNILADFSYIAAISDNNPLRNSLQFSVGIDFDFFKKKKGDRH